MHLLITCPYGTNGILNQELKLLWYKPLDCFDNGSFVQAEYQDIINLNLRSRIASKVYVQIGNTQKCETFDQLFDIVSQWDWETWLIKYANISIKVAIAHDSILHSATTIQSVTHKAILNRIWVNESDYNQSNKQSIKTNDMEIFVHIQNNKVSTYLNTSGNGLHERWYRKESGEAPLKENVAAALVLMSGRTWKNNLWDPCCGSGTLCIEAAMIARDIAPWLQRIFAFQYMHNYDKTLFDQIKQQCIDDSFPNKMYNIIWSDIDPSIIKIAKDNAKRAWVADTIQFIQHNFLEESDSQSYNEIMWIIWNSHKSTNMVSNPPYGKRLSPLDIHEIYQKFAYWWFLENSKTCIISSYEDFDKLTQGRWNSREIKNGADICKIWTKKEKK